MNALDQTSATDVTAKQRPYRVYAVILCAIPVARLLQVTAQGVYEGASWRPALLLLSLFSSGLSALYFKRRIPRFLSWLLCGCVGAMTTLVVEPLSGATVGFVIGAVVLTPRTYYEFVWRATQPVLRFVATIVLPVTALAVSSGGIAAWMWWRWAAADPRVGQHLVMLSLPVAVGCAVTIAWMGFTSQRARGGKLLVGMLFFVIFAICTVLPSIDARTRSVRSSISTVQVNTRPLRQIVQLSVNPFATNDQLELCDQVDAWLKYWGLQPALGLVADVVFTQYSARDDIHRVAQIPLVTSVYVRAGSVITDADFQKLNTRGLAMLTCEEGSQLTDDAFVNVDFSRVGNLDLRGPNFGDGVVSRLGHIPWMATIALNGTRVTTQGLEKIDTTGPLYWLHLRDTQVEDSVFSVLDKHDRLWWVDLSGTRVTGSGIKNFRTSITSLTLNHSRFESRYLADFQPPPGAKATPWNSLMVDRLSFAHTAFDEDLFETLMKLRTSLKFVDVAGSDLSLEQLQKLRLSGYGLDAELLTPGNVAQLGQAELYLHYDAKKITPAEIVKHFTSVKAGRQSIPTTPNVGTVLVIENLELSKDAIQSLDRIGQDIELAGAITPDGQTKSFSHLASALEEFPELRNGK